MLDMLRLRLDRWLAKAHAAYTVLMLVINRHRWPREFDRWLRARAVAFVPDARRFWIFEIGHSPARHVGPRWASGSRSPIVLGG